MTREETLPNMSHKEMIDTLKGLVFGTFDRTTVKEREALDMAIKALGQEPILDKIRAEIADLDDADYDYEGYYKAVTDAVKIIDKYRAESEE